MEFSVENRAAVKAKLQRAQKSLDNVKKGIHDKPLPENSSAIDIPVPQFSGAKSDPKIKTLPSHSGPKIRHRKRPNPVGAEVASPKKPKIRRKMFKKTEDRKATMKKKLSEVNVKKSLQCVYLHI